MGGGAPGWAQSIEHVTLDLGAVSLSPTLGIKDDLKKKKKAKETTKVWALRALTATWVFSRPSEQTASREVCISAHACVSVCTHVRLVSVCVSGSPAFTLMPAPWGSSQPSWF